MKLLLAVSGGIDSMYMAERALEGALSGLSCEEFAVANCNFHLRGEESDEDSAFVRDWCTRHGVRLHVTDFDTATFASSKAISIEMAARELRYGWFASLCEEFGYDAVAVAHNADDNAETLLLNMLRGCGTRGLRGISPDSGIWPRRVIRPILETPRADIEAWMERRGLQWREDSSNAEDKYKRNALRHNVMPVFKQLNPSYLKTLGADMKRFAQVDDIADEYYRNAAAQLLDSEGSLNLKKLITYTHWEYLLYRFTEGRLNADGLFRLKESVKSGHPAGGKIFGPYKVVRGKLKLI